MIAFERAGPRYGLSERSAWIGVSLVAAFLHAAWFSPLLVAGAVQNQDVAGIVYNARVLLNGGLPYLDTTEMKSPGAFFAVAPAVALGGLRGMWLLAIVWATATSLATGWLVKTCWGPRQGLLAVLIHAAGAHAAGIGDANYSFWMMLPFTLAQAAVLSMAAPARVTWMSIGALACAALVFKHNAVTLALPLAVGVVRATKRLRSQEIVAILLCAAAGAGVVLGCLVGPYVLAGKAGALIHALEAQWQYSSAYLDDAGNNFGGPLALLIEGTGCALSYAPALFALAALGMLRVRPQTVAPGTWVAVASVALSALVALGMTLRFYHHDLVIIWPVIVLLALAPGGVPDTVLQLSPRPSLRAAGAVTLGLLVSAASFPQAMAIRRYLIDLDANVAELCRIYSPALGRDDTVFAWGWNAWSTYEHCRRFAPGPHYKELGIVTTPNTNTCARPYGAPMRLLPGADVDALEQELRANPPALVVVAPYYRDMQSPDPLLDLHGTQALLQSEYIPMRWHRGFKMWLHRRLDLATVDHRTVRFVGN